MVAPVGIREGSKPESTLLVNYEEVFEPGQVAKQVLGRPHVSFLCGVGHGSCQLIDRVEDAVAGDLCEVHHGSSDPLVAPLLLLVQQLLLRLVQGQFRLYSEDVRGVTAFHTIALYHVLCVVFLVDGEGSSRTVTGDVHAEDFQYSVQVERLKPFYELLLELVEQILAGAEEQNVVNVERQDDEASLVLVDVYAGIQLERAKATVSFTSTVPNQFFGFCQTPDKIFLIFRTRGTPALSLIS